MKEACGFSTDSLILMHSYLVGRRQRVKIGTSFSAWQEIKSGILQGSVLEPFLFSQFINNLFYEIQHYHVCNFAKVTESRYCPHMEAAITWYKNNEMAANPEKFQLMIT